MSDPPPIRLTLELDCVDPPRGQLGPAHGPLEAFSGWIGLAATLDRAVREHERRPAVGSGPTDGGEGGH